MLPGSLGCCLSNALCIWSFEYVKRYFGNTYNHFDFCRESSNEGASLQLAIFHINLFKEDRTEHNSLAKCLPKTEPLSWMYLIPKHWIWPSTTLIACKQVVSSHLDDLWGIFSGWLKKRILSMIASIRHPFCSHFNIQKVFLLGGISKVRMPSSQAWPLMTPAAFDVIFLMWTLIFPFPEYFPISYYSYLLTKSKAWTYNSVWL